MAFLPLAALQRTTTSGEACLLPAVFRGHLFFDCVDYSDAQTGTAEICPTQVRCNRPAPLALAPRPSCA